jgi:hypothetical protein
MAPIACFAGLLALIAGSIMVADASSFGDGGVINLSAGSSCCGCGNITTLVRHVRRVLGAL